MESLTGKKAANCTHNSNFYPSISKGKGKGKNRSLTKNNAITKLMFTFFLKMKF